MCFSAHTHTSCTTHGKNSHATKYSLIMKEQLTCFFSHNFCCNYYYKSLLLLIKHIGFLFSSFHQFKPLTACSNMQILSFIASVVDCHFYNTAIWLMSYLAILSPCKAARCTLSRTREENYLRFKSFHDQFNLLGTSKLDFHRIRETQFTQMRHQSFSQSELTPFHQFFMVFIKTIRLWKFVLFAKA